MNSDAGGNGADEAQVPQAAKIETLDSAHGGGDIPPHLAERDGDKCLGDSSSHREAGFSEKAAIEGDSSSPLISADADTLLPSSSPSPPLPASEKDTNEASLCSSDSQASSFDMLVNTPEEGSSAEELEATIADVVAQSPGEGAEERLADAMSDAAAAADAPSFVATSEVVASAKEAGNEEENRDTDEENMESEEDVVQDGAAQELDMESFERQIQRLESLDQLELPQTVARLKTKYGTRIFLVGTAHFSTESQDDVAATINAVEPDVVMVELCDSRQHILSLDEETILRESQKLNMSGVMEMVKKVGFLQGISYVLLLNLSAHITKQLGMAPGGEFRRAFVETRQLQSRKKVKLHLGDRPVHVTLKRALGMLTIWQKLHLCWTLLTDKFDISKEEIEKMKQKDMLETLLQEMAKDYPTLSQVFVHERDVWLAHALTVSEAMAIHGARQITMNGMTHVLPSVVVGVVGMGHQPGIVEEWRKIDESQLSEEEKNAVLMELVRIPPPSMASRVLSLGFKAAKLTLILWSCHKVYKWIYP